MFKSCTQLNCCKKFLELNVVDKEIARTIDIGYPAPKRNRNEELRAKTAYFMQQKKDPNIERAARLNKCMYRNNSCTI